MIQQKLEGYLKNEPIEVKHACSIHIGQAFGTEVELYYWILQKQ
ncbi:hypothetical protein MHB42_07635 [Lysinibacillus sp. FSL K6-0232]